MLPPDRTRTGSSSPSEPGSLRAGVLAPPALAGALALAFLCASSLAAEAQRVRGDFWVTNGPVEVAVRSGNTLYIGGEFSQVGPATGGGAPFDATNGVPVSGFPKVNGTVLAVVSDGSGGWYIGGSFTAVGGVPRNDIAHILADHSISPWNPDANNSIDALVLSGTTVYAGGTFTAIGGQSRNAIAALDATTGRATAWNPNPNVYSFVSVLAVNGTTVYAGGFFATIGGETRNNIAALDAVTGLATAWNPDADNTVHALVVSGATVYVGGNFTTIGGLNRVGIAAVDAATGLPIGWDADARPFGTVSALAVSGTTVYAGGYFNRIGGLARNGLAALDAATGRVNGWTPDADGVGLALALSGNTLYVGGSFTNLDGHGHNHLAALDLATGRVAAWDPSVNSAVLALAVSGTRVYAGGLFTSIGGETRNGVAALDVTTGTITAWDPNAQARGIPRVLALAVSRGLVYAGGEFTGIGGQARKNIAALDVATGLATPWNPGAEAVGFIPRVSALAVSGGTVYAGGAFTRVGGQPRSHIAALDASTGLAIAWNPNANFYVDALAWGGATVYAGGDFNWIGGQGRNHLAALDATTGLATAWDPSASNRVPLSGASVHALAVSGPTIYAGGVFTDIGGQSRGNVAALDASTGLATAWNPNASSSVRFNPPSVDALAVSGTTIYAGGNFTDIGGQERRDIAALDVTTGLATAWNANAISPYPDVDDQVLAVAVTGATVYAGGDFWWKIDLPHSYFVSIEPANRAPDCSHASASRSELWPPDRRLVPIEIRGVTDPDGDPVTITVASVTQDEPLLDHDTVEKEVATDDTAEDATPVAKGGENDRVGSGVEHRHRNDTCPDAVLDGRGAELRAERSARGNGRVYAIRFTASDGRGGSCDGVVPVCVRPGSGRRMCIDDGRSINSLGPCPRRHRGDDVDRVALEELKLAVGARAGNTTTLEYSLPEDGPVRLAVLDLAGRRVALLEDGPRSAGPHRVSWVPSGLPAGMYFCTLEAGGARITKAVLHLE